MALTYVHYTGTGTLRNFSVPFPYIEKNHVKVEVDGDPVAFIWLTATTVQLAVAPPEGAQVAIRRETPTTPMVDFQDGSTLTESDLDLAVMQSVYIAAEAFGAVAEATDSSEEALAKAREALAKATQALLHTTQLQTPADGSVTYLKLAPDLRFRFVDATDPQFGAKGTYNNETNTGPNSTAGIQAALDYAAAQGGGIVFVPKGHYKQTATWNLRPNTTLFLAEGAVVWRRHDASLLAALDQEPDDAGYDVYLLAGQSNIVGWYGPIDNTLDAADALIDQWPLSGTTGAAIPATAALRFPTFRSGTVGPGLSFAKGLLPKLRTNRKILLVPAAVGATNLTHAPTEWAPGDSLHTQAVDACKAALAANPNSRFRGIVWGEGESDRFHTNVEKSYYRNRVIAAITAFRTSIPGAENAPVVISGFVPEYNAGAEQAAWNTIVSALADAPKYLSNSAFVPGPTGFAYAGDEIHFTAAGNRARGQHFASAMLTLAQTGSYERLRNINVIGGVWDMNVLKQGNDDANWLSSAHGRDMIVRGCTVRDVPGVHALDVNSWDGLLVEDCRFEGWLPGVIYTETYREAIQLSASTPAGIGGTFHDAAPTRRVVVRRNYFGPSGTPGTTAWPCAVGNHGSVYNTYTEDVEIYENTFDGLLYAGVRPFKWRNVRIHHNLFDRCARGVIISNVGWEAGSSKDIVDVQRFQAASSEDIWITENVFREIRGNVVYTAASTPTKARLAETPTAGFPAYEIPWVKNVRVLNNKIVGQHPGDGGAACMGFFWVDGLWIEGNDVSSVYRAVLLGYVKNASIRRNYIKDTELEAVSVDEDAGDDPDYLDQGFTANIQIEDNAFENIPYSPVIVRNAWGGSIKGNSAINVCTLPGEDNTRAVYRVETNAKDITIFGNKNRLTAAQKAGTVAGPNYGIRVTATCSGVRVLANDAEGKTGKYLIDANSPNTAGGIDGVPFVVGYSSTPIAHTGTTAETTLATVVLPPGVLGKNGFLRVTSYWSMTNNANGKTLRTKVAGTTIAGGSAETSTASRTRISILKNVNSEQVQVSYPATAAGEPGLSGGVPSTYAFDTSQARALTFTAQLANATDTATLEYFIVEAVYLP